MRWAAWSSRWSMIRMSDHESKPNKYVPVQVEGMPSESMWAEPLSRNRLRLDNVPVFFEGVSLNDKLLAQRIDGSPVFVRVLEQGGHSTLSIAVNLDLATDEDFDQLDAFSQENDWWIRPVVPGIVSVDIGPKADLRKSQAFLANRFAQGIEAHRWRNIRLKPGHSPKHQEVEYEFRDQDEIAIRDFLSQKHGVTFGHDFREPNSFCHWYRSRGQPVT